MVTPAILKALRPTRPRPPQLDELAEGEQRVDVAKLVRLGQMLSWVLHEVRELPMDDRDTLAAAVRLQSALDEIIAALPPPLAEELAALQGAHRADGPPSRDVLRVQQAQVIGWLQGMLHGLQIALVPIDVTGSPEDG